MPAQLARGTIHSNVLKLLVDPPKLSAYQLQLATRAQIRHQILAIMPSPCREAQKMHLLGQPVLDVDAKASSEHLFCPGAQNMQKFAARN